jgi:hypothetical protein
MRGDRGTLSPPSANSRRVEPRPRYPWRKRDRQRRWELVLLGEPDCYAYITRYENHDINDTAVWAWTLTMPRGGRELARGWDTMPHKAKRQVEAAIEHFWPRYFGGIRLCPR